MSCFLLKLCPILVLYLYHVAAVSFLGPNTSQLGTSGNKSMCFSKKKSLLFAICILKEESKPEQVFISPMLKKNKTGFGQKFVKEN